MTAPTRADGLDLKTLVNELQGVSDWYTLGIQLDIQYSKLDEIQSNYPSENSRCKTEMLKFWLSNDLHCSWHKLAKALENAGHKRLADNIERKHCKGAGPRHSTILQARENYPPLQQTSAVKRSKSTGSAVGLQTRVRMLQAHNQHLESRNQVLKETVQQKESEVFQKQQELDEKKNECEEMEWQLIAANYHESDEQQSSQYFDVGDAAKSLYVGEEVEMPDQREENQDALVWWEGKNAPLEMRSGSCAVKENTVYISPAEDPRMFAYNVESDEWSTLPKCSQYNFGLAVIDNLFLTAVGGRKGDGCTNTLVTLSACGEWLEVYPPMELKRACPAVFAHSHALAVAGGTSVRGSIRSVEVLHTETKQWFNAPSLPLPSCRMSMTMSGSNLYACGGYAERNKSLYVFKCSWTALLQSCYSQPMPNIWNTVADAPTHLLTGAASSFDCGRLIAVGGCNPQSESELTNHVFSYDAEGDRWTVIGCMPTSRYRCFAALTVNGKLVVIGGQDSVSSSFRNTVECVAVAQ